MNKPDAMTILKNQYNDIQIPEELTMVVQRGLFEARKDKRSADRKRRVPLQVAAALLLSLGLFTSAVNFVPAFADSLRDLPILGTLVELVDFRDGKAQGGTITDGKDIGSVERIETPAAEGQATETLVIRFNDAVDPSDLAAYYTIQYDTHPYTLQFDIYGARYFTGLKDLEQVVESPLIAKGYRLMTLDDSLIRFTLELDQPVQVRAEERKEPASLAVHLTADETQQDLQYSVRTISVPFSEGLGRMEEAFYGRETVRMLQDVDGNYLVEVARFDTLGDARAAAARLSQESGYDLHVEKRTADQQPSSIGMSESSEPQETVEETPATEAAPTFGAVVFGQTHYEVDIHVKSDGLHLVPRNQDMETRVFDYGSIQLIKRMGEASFMLDIVTQEETITVSGLYSDFFEAVAAYTTVE